MKKLRKVSEVQMLGTRVLLKAPDLKNGEKTTASGFIVQEEKDQHEAVIAEVVATGNGATDFYVGDKVIIVPGFVLDFIFSREQFEQEEGMKYYQCDAEDLFGKI